MADERTPVITLTTDFGTQDHFVGTMKGVILGINPNVQLVDITHELPPHDVIGAAFSIRCSYAYFPRWSIHLVVVDPTVGSQRRPILVVGDQHYFIGPDNGVFSLVYEVEPYIRVYHLTETHFFLSEISTTFHGRDIFAPVAAWLAKGVEPAQMGEVIEDFVRIPIPRPIAIEEKTMKGVVLYVDRFGNLITNFTRESLAGLLGEDLSQPCVVQIQNQSIPGLKSAYFEVPQGQPVALIGSTGYLEIGANQASAARILKAGRGTEVIVVREGA